jgi:hypothetical protein
MERITSRAPEVWYKKEEWLEGLKKTRVVVMCFFF